MKKFAPFFLALLSSLLLTAPVNAQTRVVVIPMGGDAAPLANIVTVAKSNGDFDDPIEAVNSISDAGADNPYLVVIAPGKYTLSGALQMKNGVSISGSGVDVTILEGGVSGGDIHLCYLVHGSDATLSHMTIRNTGGAGCSVGISTVHNQMRIEHVKVIATGAGTTAYGLHNYGITNNAAPTTITTMNDVHIEGEGSGAYGVYNDTAGVVVIKNSLLRGVPPGAGIRINSTLTRITNTRISGGVTSDPGGSAQCRDTYDVNLGTVSC